MILIALKSFQLTGHSRANTSIKRGKRQRETEMVLAQRFWCTGPVAMVLAQRFCRRGFDAAVLVQRLWRTALDKGFGRSFLGKLLNGPVSDQY